jgi:hypothetical protein
MKSFLLKLALFSVLIAFIDLCWIHFAPTEKYIPHVWPLTGFFIFITVTFHFLSINASKGKPQAFIRFYMGSTALRLMLYILIIIAYRFYDKPTLIPFAVGFMVHYLLFTLFEVPLLLKELRNS